MPSATLHLEISDGSKTFIPSTSNVLLTVRPQFNSDPVFAKFVTGNSFNVPVDVPPDGSGYCVVASIKGHEQGGIGPLPVTAGNTHNISLMLLGRNSDYRFERAGWEQIKIVLPSLARFLAAGIGPEQAAARYATLMANSKDSLACLLNIAVAVNRMPLQNLAEGVRKPLDYLLSINWDNGIRRDRFFGRAKKCFLTDLEEAKKRGEFDEEPLPFIFHPGASKSYKQNAFDEANVQITFLGEPQNGEIDVELDMDYFKDGLAHALLEAIPNTLSVGQRKTDPRQIYVQRCMADRKPLPFDPLYVIQ